MCVMGKLWVFWSGEIHFIIFAFLHKNYDASRMKEGSPKREYISELINN